MSSSTATRLPRYGRIKVPIRLVNLPLHKIRLFSLQYSQSVLCRLATLVCAVCSSVRCTHHAVVVCRSSEWRSSHSCTTNTRKRVMYQLFIGSYRVIKVIQRLRRLRRCYFLNSSQSDVVSSQMVVRRAAVGDLVIRRSALRLGSAHRHGRSLEIRPSSEQTTACRR